LFHKTWLAHYLQPQFIIFDNGSIGKFKHDFKQMCEMKIMALKSNQLHVTAKCPKVNVIIEQVYKVLVVNDMLRLCDLENNHENIEQQEDNPFDYFLQSTA
jgi:hypothetical protein